MPKALTQTITGIYANLGIYAYRSGGDGVGHGGSAGGAATAEVAEYVLAVCASQIIYLVDVSNAQDNDLPAHYGERVSWILCKRVFLALRHPIFKLDIKPV